MRSVTVLGASQRDIEEGHNEETLIILRMEKKLVYKEYQASEGEEDAASEGYFMSLWRTSEELSHVEMARKVWNFHLCTTHNLRSVNNVCASAVCV